MIDVVYLAYSNEKIGYGIEIVEKFLLLKIKNLK